MDKIIDELLDTSSVYNNYFVITILFGTLTGNSFNESFHTSLFFLTECLVGEKLSGCD